MNTQSQPQTDTTENNTTLATLCCAGGNKVIKIRILHSIRACSFIYQFLNTVLKSSYNRQIVCVSVIPPMAPSERHRYGPWPHCWPPWDTTMWPHVLIVLHHHHHHQSRVTSWGRSALQLQRSTAMSHATSAEIPVSVSTCRPGRHFQCGLLSGRPPARVSTASRIAIRPVASLGSRRTCPKTAARRLRMWLVRSSCSVWLVTSALVTRRNQRILRMCRWHDMWMLQVSVRQFSVWSSFHIHTGEQTGQVSCRLSTWLPGWVWIAATHWTICPWCRRLYQSDDVFPALIVHRNW